MKNALAVAVSIVVVMKHTCRSITRQLSLVILLTGRGTALAAVGIAEATAIRPDQLPVMLGSTTIILALLTLAIWYVSKRLVSRPIKDVKDVANAVREISASQNHSARVDGQSRNGAIVLLVDDLNELLEQMEEMEERHQHLQEEHDRHVREHDQYLRGEGFRLEEKVVARTRELGESNEQLEAAAAEATASNERKNRVIADMSHELRTPMNGVMGVAELLLTTDLTPQQLGYARTIVESAEDLVSLVNNILDFSKVEAGELDRIDDEPFSPRECVEKVSLLLSARAEMKKLRLSQECANDLPKAILGDPKRLRQVLINIVGNAIKFTEGGTIVTRTSLVEQVGDVSTIRFEVVDTGIGIPSHLHEHIFEGFAQADRSTARQFGGAGLGLAISKHLVELMGGEIGLVSRPGVGSNFWFTIKGEHRHPVTGSDHDLRGSRALIVATSSESRDALRNLLAQCGGAGIAVPSVEEALGALRAESFNVVLVDMQLNDAQSLARETRASAATKSLPLVLISNLERGRDELAEIGIDGSLTKPVKQRELFGCVARLTGLLDVVPSIGQEALNDDAYKKVAGARILVVEDHPVNRDVAVTLLETLKCSVDIAEDGTQAVNAVQRESYDLILLDCQMPELDGYEAAREIRRLEQQGQVQSKSSSGIPRHLPIVALTAHAASEDRARCLESGMDDFFCKPFTLQMLRAVLAKWVKGQGESAAPHPPPASASPTPAPPDDAPISEAAIEQVLELDRINGGGIFARFAHSFLEAVPITLEQLRTAVREDDAVGIAKSAHALRGASLNVEAQSMAALSRELETLARDGTTEGTSSLAAQLDELYLAVKAALEAQLKKNRSDDAVSV